MNDGVLQAVLDVFTDVGSWFSTFVPTLFSLFYTPDTASSEGGLTFLGVLACASLAIGVVMLVMNVISDFLRFSR